MKQFLEGSAAVAHAVALCRPGVISAYPITPQTHIVEELANMVADGKLNAQFVNVESEHSAASLVLGASAAGVRAFTATSSQGFLLMIEVLYNIAGMRLPLVLTCANRAVSAPISIWNDHQDSVTARDAGWIQFYAETIQEAHDLHIQAYRISEMADVMLPVMVCMDGYILTHAFQTVDVAEQEKVDGFLPPYDPPYKLDTENPITMGMLATPDHYMETRYDLHSTMKNVLNVIPGVVGEFQKGFGRKAGGLFEAYRTEDAERIIVAKGSVVGIVKEVVDALRDRGEKVGVLKVITYRPFPGKELFGALKKAPRIGVVEKSISLGAYGPLYADLKAAFHGNGFESQISGFVAGLGGRDITESTIEEIFKKLSGEHVDDEFIGLKAQEAK